MFFENEAFSFNILDVLYLEQEKVNIFNSGRNFSALSFRFQADTIIATEVEEYHLHDNFVSYIPARLDYTRNSKKDEMIVIHLEASNHSTKKVECFESKSPEALARLFRNILDLWNKKEVGYKLKCAAVLYDILAECYIQNYRQEPQKSKIQPSVDYLYQNYKKSDLSIKEVADKSFVSEVYFRKLFKEKYGISPQKYLVNLRIQNAAQLISTGYYSLKEVAYMSGYTDYKYFSIEFKKLFGVSPSKYIYNY